MSIPGSALPLLLASPAGAAAGYEIERSLRFNSADSAYLNRTPASAGNRKTWTYSVWLKRSELNTSKLFRFWSAGVTQQDSIYFNTNDTLQVYLYGGQGDANTLAKFRDTSAWYHIVLSVDTTQATTADRIRIYVNGEDLTNYVACTQNLDCSTNLNALHTISTLSDSPYAGANPFDGYLADAHLIDGAALDPTSFGEFDDNGVWQPIEYAGTYGTNGFHLPFNDNSSASALGTDDSGNGNNFTVNNISVASGAGNDSLRDSPTNGNTANDTGAGGEVPGNYCTLNPLHRNSSTPISLLNGNLQYAGPSSDAWGSCLATFAMPSGKWYWEQTPTASSSYAFAGFGNANAAVNNLPTSPNSIGYFFLNGSLYGSLTGAQGASLAANDVMGIAVDVDAGTVSFYKNGAQQGSTRSHGISGPLIPLVSNYDATGTGYVNFGQRPFAYSAPSGFKALCTANLDTPTIEDGSTAMDVVTYTGTGSALTPTSTLGFNPDLVWIKSRSAATDHALYDAVRGVEKRLESNADDAEVTSDGGVTAFNSAGFSVGTLAQVNTSSTTYVGWTWDAGSSTAANTDGSISSSVRANPTAGFSIVSYTGAKTTTTADTVGHGLNIEPAMLIVKDHGTARSWLVYHKYNTHGNQNPNTNSIRLSTDGGSFTGNSWPWGSTTPTSSVFTINNLASSSYYNLNESGKNYIAYCFAPVEGYSAFGSYTGNGSTDGPFVATGMRPRWIMVKRIDATSNWTIIDTAREGYNVDNDPIYPNLNNAEGTTDLADILSNGFKLRSTDASVNASSSTYVYACFGESPFKYARAR